MIDSCAVDNTASLRATQNRKPHPAHYLVDELLLRINALQRRHPGIDFTLRWVPGHKGIEGNELADAEAKKAARGDSSPTQNLPTWLQKRGSLPKSVSKVRQTLNATVTKQAKEEWRRSPRAARMDRIDEHMPSRAYRKCLNGYPDVRRVFSYNCALSTYPSRLICIGYNEPTHPYASNAAQQLKRYITTCANAQRTRSRGRDLMGMQGRQRHNYAHS